jgi:aminoglycoside phosphotransferase
MLPLRLNHGGTPVPQILSLSQQQANRIARLMGIRPDVHITEITQHNHVWQLQGGQDTVFLKTFTKSWYGDDVAGTAYCVQHEHDAYACLAAHGLPTPEVLLTWFDCDNPLGRPFIVTRKLNGDSLMTLLQTADARLFQTLLERTGDYLRRMHAIHFAFPGNIIGDGPTAPPDENGWQHPSWSARKTQQEALAALEADRPHLPVDLYRHLDKLFSTMQDALAPSFQPPRFVQVNCHANQFFLGQAVDSWQVSGCIDMEVASAGCCYYDLVGFGIQMAAFFPSTTQWWEPFFRGYGHEPDFGLFKLIMLMSTRRRFQNLW